MYAEKISLIFIFLSFLSIDSSLVPSVPEIKKQNRQELVFTSYGKEGADEYETADFGYFHIKSNTYIADFTDCSKLILIKTTGEFTSGHIACQNGMNGYNDVFHLKKGFIHVEPRIVEDSHYNHSASYTAKSRWPLSPNATSTISSSYSNNYTFNSAFEKGISMDGGSSIIQKSGVGLSFSFDNSVAVSKPDPAISSQYGVGDKEDQAQWNYCYAVEGYETLTLDTYYLLEVKNDAVGYNQYSIGYNVSGYMNNISWHNTWWEGHGELNSFSSIWCNLI